MHWVEFVVGFIMGVLVTVGAQTLFYMSVESAEHPSEEDIVD